MCQICESIQLLEFSAAIATRSAGNKFWSEVNCYKWAILLEIQEPVICPGAVHSAKDYTPQMPDQVSAPQDTNLQLNIWSAVVQATGFSQQVFTNTVSFWWSRQASLYNVYNKLLVRDNFKKKQIVLLKHLEMIFLKLSVHRVTLTVWKICANKLPIFSSPYISFITSLLVCWIGTCGICNFLLI